MSTEYLIDEISKHFNINLCELREFVNKLETANSLRVNKMMDNIILPFCGFIDDNKCYGVIYNHGLYTQCNNLADTFCKKCKTSRKYGTIQERAKHELGKFSPDNKKHEVAYDKFIKKMGYDLNDVKDELKRHNLSYPLITNLKKTPVLRGRPKKSITCLDGSRGVDAVVGVGVGVGADMDSDEEIEVEKIMIGNSFYYKTKEDVILDIKSHEIKGILVNGNIESINQ